MAQIIPNMEQRAVIVKMVIEIAMTFCKAMSCERRPGQCLAEMLLYSAVMVGHAEGRLLNASKLADYVGIARPTVVRKLDKMQKSGLVERHGNTYRISPSSANGDAMIRASQQARKLIVQTHHELSRLDTKAVAERAAARI